MDYLPLLRALVHDLRNPLGTIIGTLDMFNEGMLGELSPQQSRAIARLDRNSQRILLLLEEFMLFVRASARDYPLNIQAFSPADFIQQIIASLQPHLQEKKLSFSNRFSPDFPAQILGDADLLGKIFSALLWNALEATTEGGITLQHTWAEGWQVAIIDSGRGILPAHQKAIFDPFWQSEPKPQLSPSSRFGLGLALARSLAEFMGGALVLEKSDEKGSHFQLHLGLIPANTE